MLVKEVRKREREGEIETSLPHVLLLDAVTRETSEYPAAQYTDIVLKSILNLTLNAGVSSEKQKFC